ncbi:MAG: hypothetical protein ACLR0U_20605 [Enterocloster clostridioformis]
MPAAQGGNIPTEVDKEAGYAPYRYPGAYPDGEWIRNWIRASPVPKENIPTEVDKKLDTRLTGTQEHILTEVDKKLDTRPPVPRSIS